jgi:hypothetical protein
VCDAAGAGEPPTDVAGGTVAVVGTAGEGGDPSGALAAAVVFATEDIGAAAAAPAPHATPSAAIVAATTRADGRHGSGMLGTMSLNDHGALLVERLMTHIVHPHTSKTSGSCDPSPPQPSVRCEPRSELCRLREDAVVCADTHDAPARGKPE